MKNNPLIKNQHNPLEWAWFKAKKYPLILSGMLLLIAISLLLPIIGVSLPYITPLLSSLTFSGLGNAAIPISYMLTAIITVITGFFTSAFIGLTFDKVKYSYQTLIERNNQLNNRKKELKDIYQLGKSKRSLFSEKENANHSPSRRNLQQYYAGFISNNKNVTEITKAGMKNQLLWAHCSGWVNVESKSTSFIPVAQIKQIFADRKLELKDGDYKDSRGRRIDKSKYRQLLTETDSYWLDMKNSIAYLERNEQKLTEINPGERKAIEAEIDYAKHEGLTHRKIMEQQLVRINQTRINSYALIGAPIPDQNLELLRWYAFSKGLCGFQLKEDTDSEAIRMRINVLARLSHPNNANNLRDSQLYRDLLIKEYKLILKTKKMLEQALKYNSHHHIAMKNHETATESYKIGRSKAKMLKLILTIMRADSVQEAKEWEKKFETCREIRQSALTITQDWRELAERWDKLISGSNDRIDTYKDIGETYKEIGKDYRNISKRYDRIEESMIDIDKRIAASNAKQAETYEGFIRIAETCRRNKIIVQQLILRCEQDFKKETKLDIIDDKENIDPSKIPIEPVSEYSNAESKHQQFDSKNEDGSNLIAPSARFFDNPSPASMELTSLNNNSASDLPRSTLNEMR